MMDEPINPNDHDSTEQSRQRPEPAADKESPAAKLPPELIGIAKNRQRKKDVDDSGENPHADNPSHTGPRNEDAGKRVDRKIHGWSGGMATVPEQSSERHFAASGKARVGR